MKATSLTLGLAFCLATTSAAAQSNPLCNAALQGRIAWDYNGNTVWAENNMARLCRGGRGAEPAQCFQRIMHGSIDWGGGTQWQWSNAISVCEGTQNAALTVTCFQLQRAAGRDWLTASTLCRTGGARTAPAAVPAPAPAAPVYAPPPRPAPPPSECLAASASGESITWTCTANRMARQRCFLGRVQTDACGYGCLSQPPGVDDVCGPAPVVQAPPPPPPPPPTAGPVSAAEFAQLQDAVRRALMDDDKVGVVRDILRGAHRRFTCDQAATLMRGALMDSARIEIGVLLYPRLVDSENFYLLTQAFLMPSAAGELRARTGR